MIKLAGVKIIIYHIDAARVHRGMTSFLHEASFYIREKMRYD